MRTTEPTTLAELNGSEWPQIVGDVWEKYRSRFATPWDELPHHDQVSIYRLLLAGEEAAND